MELAFAGLHQLCAPMLDHAERLPAPQRDALRTAFGLVRGPPPDRFLVGAGGAEPAVGGGRGTPADLRDRRRAVAGPGLGAGAGVRGPAAGAPTRSGWCSRPAIPGAELAGLPELEVDGLRDDDARALLDSALTGPLDARVRDLIVAETRGNPLALLELPRGLTPGGAGGRVRAARRGAAAGPDRGQLPRGSWTALPAQTRRLLLLAAADPSGDRSLVWRAAGRLGIPVQAGAPAVGGGAGRVRRPGAVPASAGALGGLPVGVVRREAAGARGAGGGDRPAGRPGPPGLAPGPGRGRAG